MTVLAGVETTQSVWVATDSMLTDDHKRICGVEKLLHTSGGVLALGGDEEAELLVRQALLTADGDPHELARLLYEATREVDSSFQALYAHATGLYHISGSGCAYRDPRGYAASGIGGDYALGALCVLEPHLQTRPTDCLRAAVKIACSFSVYCGGDVQIREVPRCP